jgi:signal-transduction protein with cAMP-binding, CBS, and nucleotidyltransferase domain
MKTAEEILKEKARDIISVTPETTIEEALQLMVYHKIGAILIKDGDDITGIWTERDLMQDILQNGFDIRQSPIGDYMTTGLLSAPHTDTCFELMDKFLGMRLRHLLIEKNGRYIGMLSAGDIMKETLLEKTREYEALNFKVSWDYYEDWRTPVTKVSTETNDLYLPYPASVKAYRSR